jgi:hypothetical protein
MRSLAKLTTVSWIEHLRCPMCGKTGDAEISEIAPFVNRFDKIPDGFEVLTYERGSDFRCGTCLVPVAP